ncbi:putative RNA recognition motif domain, nucleotide-binding alpha-beta plait domain superfamily [Helianthus annuus]|uniref:RNA recognition motif domain, nucleotide-binding alpha-beta plait domain superfamily n=1 Tax=Helianthus annuus TaxID=4232 RepID=A0A9K3HRU8_HELAN|nr:putative RNA recognition motif domain, nucleotide-binding alpha-beta plait domain superfamily [Helianthus annuus]KAJ0511017.1 putative RNA recognition motif domain, nucleotide-binding alpha-beta plait domain superfamily [Helianthus annuus]KAJ0518769.1 putative RNA recognition motif domain, nucleotide-binding alpha-beta plait domain superfamily [Helianthus annuus]KAJ0876578.1 putative RNA recognition motif domain, nucleotide-binding alpha-beta plait domain superfamily [Helianthus annuus]
MNVGEEGERWNDVLPKKNNKNKGIKDDRSRSGNISKFYITNLPHGCNTWDVADFVKVFGEVSGVYIARKKDKEGRRFGCVSFRNVADVKEMERALNGTKMGGSKLIANLAKFAKENVGTTGKRIDNTNGNGKEIHIPHQEVKSHSNAFINQGNGKLFSELFHKDHNSSARVSDPMLESKCTIEISDETSAFKDLIGYALIGRCKDLIILRSLNLLLAESRIKGVTLSYLGGLSMLLKFDEEDACSNFLLDHSVWKEWFFNLESWNCQSLPFERLAWVRILGVPKHLADNDVLNNVTEHFGKIVHGSQLETEDGDLSVSWIGLLVGKGNRIHNHVSLKWMDK